MKNTQMPEERKNLKEQQLLELKNLEEQNTQMPGPSHGAILIVYDDAVWSRPWRAELRGEGLSETVGKAS